MTVAVEKNGVRTQLLRAAAGAVVGAAGALLFMEFVAEGRMALDDPAVVLAIVAGLIYCLIGTSMAIGTIAPKTGARFLNVEDADEIREEQPKLQVASIANILIGIMLLVLAAVGEDSASLIGAGPAVVIAGFCFVGAALLSIISHRQVDELMRQMSLEASTLALTISLFLFGGWAALAHLGFVEWLAPLAYLAIVAMLELFAIFWVVGRRGMLRAR